MTHFDCFQVANVGSRWIWQWLIQKKLKKSATPTRRLRGKQSLRVSTRVIHHNVKRIDEDWTWTTPEMVDVSTQTGESESEDDLAEDDSNLDGTFDASYSTYMAAIASGNVCFQASGVEPCR